MRPISYRRAHHISLNGFMWSWHSHIQIQHINLWYRSGIHLDIRSAGCIFHDASPRGSDIRFWQEIIPHKAKFSSFLPLCMLLMPHGLDAPKLTLCIECSERDRPIHAQASQSLKLFDHRRRRKIHNSVGGRLLYVVVKSTPFRCLRSQWLGAVAKDLRWFENVEPHFQKSKTYSYSL